MMIAVSDLMRLINEASDQHVQEHDGFDVGGFYKDNDGRVGQLTALFWIDAGPRHCMLLMARQQFGGHSVELRFDAWERKGQRPATPAEVEDARADAGAEDKRTASVIDTSRQGT
jgi:hypothetical protein